VYTQQDLFLLKLYIFIMESSKRTTTKNIHFNKNSS